MAQLLRRPLRILRLDSSNAAIGIAGTSDSLGAPSFGYDTCSLHMNLLGGGGTLEMYERLRVNSTWALSFQVVLAGIGRFDTVQALHGEHVRILFTNGAVAQSPEILATLA